MLLPIIIYAGVLLFNGLIYYYKVVKIIIKIIIIMKMRRAYA
jgi:hypothetical protein